MLLYRERSFFDIMIDLINPTCCSCPIPGQEEESFVENSMSAPKKPHLADNKTTKAVPEEFMKAPDVQGEGLFEKAFYGSSVPGAIICLEDRLIVDVNDSFLRLFGYGREEVIGSTSVALKIYGNPQDRARILEGLEKQGFIRNYDLVVRTKAGRLVHLLFSADRITVDEKEYVICTGMDLTQLKQAESALKESEERFHAFTDNSPAIAWMKDEEGRYVYASQMCEKIFRISADCIGKTDYELWPPEIAERFRDNDREVLNKGEPIQVIEENVDSDGKLHHWLNSKFPFRDAAGKRYVGGIGVDITDQKRLEDAVREARDQLEIRVRERTGDLVRALESLTGEIEERKRSEELLSEMLNLATELSATSDLQAALNLCLDAALRIGRMDFGGIYLIDPVSGHLRLAAHRNIPDDFLQGIADYSPETPNARLVGACRPVYGRWKDLNLLPDMPHAILGIAILPIANEGKPVACLNVASGLFMDIPQATKIALETVVAQMGAALVRIQSEEERKRLAAVVEHAGEGMIILDKLFRIQYVNPAFASMTGYSQEELIQKDVRFLQSETIGEDTYEAARKQLRIKGSLLGRSVTNTKDGSPIPVECLLSSIKVSGRDISGYILRCRDITEQVRLEEQLRQSHKMEAVGTLAGGIAHDFNNMLAVIMGNAELALEDVNAEGPRRNLEAILGASKRSRDLVRQILTFSRKSGGEEIPVDIESLLRETYMLLRSSLPATVRIDLDLRTRQGTTVIGDPSKIQQVIVNLANNAAYAMRKNGGSLSIGVSTVTLGSDVLTNGRTMIGPHVKLTVTDGGSGIPSEIRKRIFEPFFTTKEPGQGTGMGLAVVYGIVESYNGVIEVESEVGKGSKFTVLLPQADISASQHAEAEEADLSGKEHILLIDDELPIVEMIQPMLERLGYRVTSITDAMDAIRVFSESPDSFDLILTDQTMPEMTGIELAEKVLSIRESMPIILCTGYSETISPETAKAAGIREFVMKPITKKEMSHAIRRTLE